MNAAQARRPHRRLDDRGASSAVSLALVGSLLAGSVGVGFVAQRTVLADDGTDAPAGGAVPVHTCPGGPAVDVLHPGDRVFATAVHDELDGWLRIRNPIAADERWWIESRHVGTDAPTGDLPASACDDDEPATDAAELADGPDDDPAPDEPDEGEVEVAIGPDDDPDTSTPDDERPAPGDPGDEPAPAPDRPGPAPAPAPGSPSTTPRRPPPGPNPPPPPPTAAPDTTPPSLHVSRSQPEAWETSPGLCIGKPSSSVISANASDPSGISQLRATWSVGNHHESRSLLGGSTTFGPYANPTVPSNQHADVVITVHATDAAGNTATRTTTVRLHSAAKCFG